ncbi:hypothetical protein H2O64_11905 [Kordia sp. YSTF-M3]|uniref:Lipoprotein n=1 Tax=Kordia aestuariivivens TaxID=2759037 RepID=A0ABR7QA02_9FLAO|nr:hypothetical protein [Kordia aestuariivivens]MBC8755384.1 hypothetical protein [Kordia aestuariivivens]
MKYIKIVASFSLFLFFTNCITIKKVPEVYGHSIVEGKKIKKSLGKSNYFIFYNHLYDDDFTAFTEYKFSAEENSYLQNLPVKIKGTDFLMTFHIVESTEQTANFLAPFVNRAINNSLKTDFDENVKTTETTHFFIAVYVESNSEADSLQEGSIHRAIAENYLIDFMNEYQLIGSSKELNFIIGNN